MNRPSRNRCLANHFITPADYAESVKRLLDSSPMRDLESIIGSNIVAESRHVTGEMVVRIAPFILSIVEKGCTNGVILASAMESGIKLAQYAKNLVITERFAEKICDHIRAVMTCLREYKREEAAQPVRQAGRFHCGRSTSYQLLSNCQSNG